MANFANNPLVKNVNGVEVKGRYIHQPLTIDHFGISASIKADGKVVIRGLPTAVEGSDEIEYDEVSIPASLVFKLANLLKDTRSVSFDTVPTVSKE